MRLPAVILFTLLSCTDHSSQAVQKQDSLVKPPHATPVHHTAVSDPFRFRNLVNFDVRLLDHQDDTLKASLIRTFPDDLGGLKPGQVLFIRPEQLSAMDGVPFRVYKITFSPDVPAIVPSIQFLLVDKDQSKAALFPLDQFQHLELGITNKPLLFGGVSLFGGKGFYMIYRYDGRNGFRQILDSSKDPDCGIVPVYNGSLDCISYDPFQLRLDLTDINGDNVKDLVFSGKVLYFCQGLETGYSRKDRKPVKQKNIKLTFQTVTDGDSVSWRLTDTTACHLLTNQ